MVACGDIKWPGFWRACTGRRRPHTHSISALNVAQKYWRLKGIERLSSQLVRPIGLLEKRRRGARVNEKETYHLASCSALLSNRKAQGYVGIKLSA